MKHAAFETGEWIIMRNFELPEPVAVWEIFEKICEIPHPSGHEKALSDALAALARKHGLAARQDAHGNLRIDRPAAPGRENAPRVILQGHLDMVPQCAGGVEFDFLRQGIPLELRDDGWVRSAAGTTLGADNGIGVAIAMALLLDPQLCCGALAGVFTVSEEVGLNGAQLLAEHPEFLDGDILLNLDSEEDILYIGCAGGARLTVEIPAHSESAPAGWSGATLEIHNLAGGHSGMNIADRRGNALKILAGALTISPEFRVARISGGGPDNVIPREAVATGAVEPGKLPQLQAHLAQYAAEAVRDLNVPPDFRIEFLPAPAKPDTVWTHSFQEKFLTALTGVPDGPFGIFNAVVRTSSNLASIHCDGNFVHVGTSQRSLFDAERREMSEKVGRAFDGLDATVKISHAYPGWEPASDSAVLKQTQAVYKELFGTVPEVKVIHAGLECGILSGINPALDILSFGPTLTGAHTSEEKLCVASVARFWCMIRALLEKLA